jgi:hypothetical protein
MPRPPPDRPDRLTDPGNAAAECSFAISTGQNREGVSVRKVYAGHESFEVLANNLKAAA